MLGARQMEQGASERLGLPLEQVRAARRPDEGGEGPDLAAEQVYDGMGEALDALVGEITKCLRYYESVFPTRSIERAIFLGGEALDRRLCQRVARRLNLPAQIGDPLARVSRPRASGGPGPLDGRQMQPAWAVAVGLSLGAELSQAA